MKRLREALRSMLAKRWFKRKYKEMREQDMMSWKGDERSRGDTKKNKREQDSQQGNRRTRSYRTTGAGSK